METTVISVINYKGGVGKTTLTANIGAELAAEGYYVLLIDLDPQCSLTFSFIGHQEWENSYQKSRTIKEWFNLEDAGKIELEDLILKPSEATGLVGEGKLDIISSHLGLINADLELATQLASTDINMAKRKFLNIHSRLRSGLKAIRNVTYDFILIDCPPNFNIITKNAIVASDYILVPTKPDYLSTIGIDYLMGNVKDLTTKFNDYCRAFQDHPHDEMHPEILGIVFTMLQYRNQRPISTLRPYITQTLNLGYPVLQNSIRENKTLFGKAPQSGVPVVLGKASNPTERKVVHELRAVAKEILTTVLQKAKA